MPPEQCPECGRFLKNALVAGLADAPEPCPKCGTELRAEMFDRASDGPPPAPTDAREAQEAAGGGPPPPPPEGAVVDLADGSVRPPDLPPEEVRDAPDPLAGWDAGEPRVGGPVDDQRPFPLDAVVLAGGGVAGVLLGMLLGRRRAGRRRGRRRRRTLAGVVGGLLGVGIAAAARQVWRAP